MLSIWFEKKFDIKTIAGEKITFSNVTFYKSQVIGRLIFGIGWAITGACPRPLFAQIGNGFLVVFIKKVCALAGNWVHGFFKEKRPH